MTENGVSLRRPGGVLPRGLANVSLELDVMPTDLAGNKAFPNAELYLLPDR